MSLPRTVDKARAFNRGALGEYQYDCPLDKRVLQFLGVDAKTFAECVGKLGGDDEIAKWVQRSLLARKTIREIEAFNRDSLHWSPYPGSEAEKTFREQRSKIAPGRDDVTTWFELLDLDEHRYVPRRLARAA